MNFEEILPFCPCAGRAIVRYVERIFNAESDGVFSEGGVRFPSRFFNISTMMTAKNEREKYVAYFGEKLREHLRVSDRTLLQYPRFIGIRAEVAADEYLRQLPDAPHPCVAFEKAMNILCRAFS